MFRFCHTLHSRPLSYMFRKLKLAGAHPDVLWGIDAQKAQHNGEEMIRLETLMHKRETRHQDLTNEAQHFHFWLRTDHKNNNNNNSQPLKMVECTITPLSHPTIVKRQLTSLFEQSNIMEDFEIAHEKKKMNLESVLRDADMKQTEHIQEAGSLYIRGDKAVENLRRHAVLLVVEDNGLTYLVTLPEVQYTAQEPSYVTPKGGDSTRGYKTIIGPNGEVDPDAQRFMDERGMRPFELRMAGSYSSVERFVNAFEKLERVYEIHRGRAVRPSVCIVLSLSSQENYIAADGCLVLSVHRLASWEEYLLGIPQPVWQDCVQKHQAWRVGLAPLLQERKRKLVRLADVLGFFRVTVESEVGGKQDWQELLLQRLLKEEPAIRKTMKKYNLMSDLLKKRGEIRFLEHLYSSTVSASQMVNNNNNNNNASSGRKEIGFRISGDGKVYFNQSIMNTGQILKVLKDNWKRIETFQKEHDRAVTALERLSRTIPVDFSIDTNWKIREEGNLVHCLDTFTKSMKGSEMQLQSLLQKLLYSNEHNVTKSLQQQQIKKRMVWIVAELIRLRLPR
ncbi:hypothetical protein AGDE_01209 [Angomonas deanei]|nr:hypothetical protein AGDE_01209 [Angomonas deanei]|eukprot:EPY42714.1 hypothetical protein AGDE_01209 [Angomonas deanei]